MARYRVTVTQQLDLTYELEAETPEQAREKVDAADIETLDGWEIHCESYGASVTNVEEMES